MRITTALRLASATLSNRNTQQPETPVFDFTKPKGNSDKPQCPSDRNRTDSNKSFKSILCVIWNKSVRFLAKRLLQKTQKSQTLSYRRCTSSLQNNASATEKQKGDTKKRPLDLCSLFKRLLLDETSVLAVY